MAVGGFTRALSALTVGCALTGGVAVLTATPASAGQSYATEVRAAWAHTDLADPAAEFTSGDTAPVGAWRDDAGVDHVSKAYFTVDLSAFRGKRIFSATAFIAEAGANDCATPRAVELWRTDVEEHPTWSGAPAEHVKQDRSVENPQCVAPRIEWGVDEAVSHALATESGKVTLALLVPRDKQADPAYGRQYATDLAITLVYNTKPNTPTGPMVNRQPCGDGLLSADRDPELGISASDLDGNSADITFTVWEVADPANRLSLVSESASTGSVAAKELPATFLVDGRTYEWTAQANDGDDVSPVSAPCRFTNDFTAPDQPPVVTSTDYPAGVPSGGVGIPGAFTFSANGVQDVVGFEYNGVRVAADQPGGSATVTFTPSASGPSPLEVYSFDRAGNRSPSTYYRYYAKETVRPASPLVTVSDPKGVIGQPVDFVFSTRPEGETLVEFTYQVDQEPVTTAAAGTDGTVKVTYTPTRRGSILISVRGRTAAGVESYEELTIFTTPRPR